MLHLITHIKVSPSSLLATMVWFAVTAIANHTSLRAGYLEDQRKAQNDLKKRNMDVYTQRSSGYMETQRRAQSDINYRQSVYFSPLGVNTLHAGELNRAIEVDLASRQTRFNDIQSNLGNRMSYLSNQVNNEVNGLYDFKNKQYQTQDKNRFLQGSENLVRLSNEISQFQNEMELNIVPQTRELLGVPYLDRKYEKDGYQNAQDFTNRVLYGNNGASGLVEWNRYAVDWGRNFDTIAGELRRVEDKMRDDFVGSYVLNGVKILGGAVLTITGVGAPAGGLMMTSAVTDLAQAVRNNVVLNVKGLDGFHSKAERDAFEGVQLFQKAITVAQIASSLKNLANSAVQRSEKVIANENAAKSVGLSGSDNLTGGVTNVTESYGRKFMEGFNAMEPVEKTLFTYQSANSLYTLADVTGVTELGMNDQQRSVVNAGFAGANLLVSGYQLSQLHSGLSKIEKDTPALKEGANATLREAYLQLPSQVFNNGVTIASAWGNGRRWVQENSFPLTLYHAVAYSLNVGGEILKNQVHRTNYDQAKLETTKILQNRYLDQHKKILEEEYESKQPKSILNEDRNKFDSFRNGHFNNADVIFRNDEGLLRDRGEIGVEEKIQASQINVDDMLIEVRKVNDPIGTKSYDPGPLTMVAVRRVTDGAEGFPILLNIATNPDRFLPQQYGSGSSGFNPNAIPSSNRTEIFVEVPTKRELDLLSKRGSFFEEDKEQNRLILSNNKSVDLLKYSRTNYHRIENGSYAETHVSNLVMDKPGSWNFGSDVPLKEFKVGGNGIVSFINGRLAIPNNIPLDQVADYFNTATKLGIKINPSEPRFLK